MKRITRLGVLLATPALVGVVTVGCTSTSAGEPRPQETSASDDEPDESSTPSAAPTRPRDINLAGVDPCELLPTADYPDYHLDDKPGQPQQGDNGEPQCVWPGSDVGYFGITLEPEGVDVWLDGSRTGEGEEAEPVLGFPALTVRIPGEDNTCFVAVDVADDQQVRVQVGLDLGAPSDLPPICDYAHQFATSVMSTLEES